ncbi:MAG: sigma 54-interacting transcriptional regulator [Myxococcales bacterium]|nr:sigma 54-interacting transcriptional regulator [Myxococcales bacterium]
MIDHLPLQALLQHLRRALDFDQGGRALLEAEVAAIEALPLEARVLGGSIQLHTGGQENATLLDAESRPSATLRRAVADAGQPVLLDVAAGRLLSVASGFADGVALGPRDFASRSVLRACHHLGLPLRGRAGIEGIAILEIQVADPVTLVRPLEQLQLLADCAVALITDLPPTRPASTFSIDPLPVAGERMRLLLAALVPFAATQDPLLVVGEPGAGRRLVAQWCHGRSPTREGRFLRLPGSVDRGRALFGEGETRGLLEERRGTLFIDRVTQLDADTQDALAEVLEQGRVCRRGSTDARRANLRLIFGADAGTLDALRPALAQYLAAQRFDVPPLRDRPDELAPWVEFFAARRQGGRMLLDEAARACLQAHPWERNLQDVEMFANRLHARIDPAAGRSVLVGVADVRPLLEVAEAPLPPLTLLESTARSLLASPSDGPTPLELANALPHLLLLLGEDRWGRTEAAGRLGAAASLAGDNHHRLFRKARKILDGLRKK